MTLLAGSLVVQLALGLLFGHAYDMPIFMATGYLTASGQNPYVAQDLSGVFHSPAFSGMTSIGYPPPWPLVLGVIYKLVGGPSAGLMAFNLAIKIPIIAANVGVAFLAAWLLDRQGAEARVVRKAWVFLLWNPFLLAASSAWGQFDSVVALLVLASLALLDCRKTGLSAIVLGLAVAAKPIAVPLLPLPWLYMTQVRRPGRSRYYVLLGGTLLLLCVAPFALFGWDPEIILRNWNAHLVVGGGMSLLSLLELTRGTYALDGAWRVLGVLWLPAVGVAVWSLRRHVRDLRGLLAASLVLLLVFFLTRAWLSEPNLLLLLPLVVILVHLDELPSVVLTAVWLLPLVFGWFNASLVQLLFPSMPAAMGGLLASAESYRTARLVVRSIVVLPWQAVGWWVVFCGRRELPDDASRSEAMESLAKSSSVTMDIPLPGGLSLRMSEGPAGDGPYATRQMQRGLLLLDQGQDLSEEAVGFGLPVIKLGLNTVFPGKVALRWSKGGSIWRVKASFIFNLEERLSRGASQSLRSRPLYAVKNALAAVIRRSRPLRRVLTWMSSGLRSSLGVRTVYEGVPVRGSLEVQYAVDSTAGEIQVRCNASGLEGQGVTEVIMMNEQGGHVFEEYLDAAGTALRAARIGAWDRVAAHEASMLSRQRNVIFTVAGGEGAKLYRGREVVGSRLAWCGFGLSFAPAIGAFGYRIHVARLA